MNDQDKQQCSPEAQVSPPVDPQTCSSSSSDDQQASPPPGPAPGDGSNPILASVPEDDGGMSVAPPPMTPAVPGADSPAPGQDPNGCSSLNPGACPLDEPPASAPDPTADAGKSLAWDVLGLIPGVSAVATGIDVVKAGGALIGGDTESAKHDMSDAALDGLGCLPGVGTALGLESAMWDEGAMVKRGEGLNADQAPTFSDAFYKGLPSWSDLTSPFTDPDSWTPQGPSQ